DRPTVQALLKKEAPAYVCSASFRLAFQEVAAIQQASPASAGQKRPGSAPRPSSASSKRVVAAAACRLPGPLRSAPTRRSSAEAEAAAMNPPRWPQPAADATRSSVWPQCAAPTSSTGSGMHSSQQQQQQKEREQDEAKRRQQREEAWITRPKRRRRLQLQQSPLPLSPSPSPSPSPRGGDYAAYHAALDNLAKEAQQHRPRQSPQPQQQQLHPGVAVPSSSPFSDTTARRRQPVGNGPSVCSRITGNGNGWQLGLKRKASVWAPCRPLIRFHLASSCRSGGTYLRRLEEVRRRNQRERQQLGEEMFNRSVTSAPAAANSAGSIADASNGDDQEAQKRRKKESILRYINRKGEPPSVPQQQPPPPDAGVRSAWDSVDCDVDRLDQLSATSAGAPTAAPSSARQTPRAWGARADDTGFLRRLGNAPILSGTLVDSDSLPEREVDWRGEVDGKADSESVKSPAHSDFRKLKRPRRRQQLQRLPRLLPKLKRWRRLPHSRAGRVFAIDLGRQRLHWSLSARSGGLRTGTLSGRRKKASANSVDDENRKKWRNRRQKAGWTWISARILQLAIYQSLKDFALSAATSGSGTDDEVEALSSCC
uniref:ANK_REP_REGION domain-containing protein n=1 Tax=Macrostomum lignano TaxID=282301 RepID=A0A1I8FMX0_9PLAT